MLRKRWREIRAIHREYNFFYWLLRVAAIVLVALWIGALRYHGREDRGYEMNLFTEALGIGITVLIFDQVRIYRDRESRKQRLLREVSHGTNDVAIRAVIELEHEGWLKGENGLLKGKNLDDVNLAGAQMKNANLEGASLRDADLRDANLYGASLKDATLYHADMSGANLENADLRADMAHAKLRDASLIGADLTSANLSRVDMTQAELMDANLQKSLLDHTILHGAFMMGANLSQAHLYVPDFRGAYMGGVQMTGDEVNSYATEKLLLPDGTTWNHTTDWGRFTDVFHEEFQETRQDIDDQRAELGFES